MVQLSLGYYVQIGDLEQGSTGSTGLKGHTHEEKQEEICIKLKKNLLKTRYNKYK